jgi:phosphoribosylaminoimidazolecarboxamide formyltransferase / IMP cyclohydrolase
VGAQSRRALLSLYDKTGLAAFARALVDLGFELLSTGGTAKALRAEGLAVTDVSQVTGFPEVLGGRVKTLHPAIHAGILARRELPEDMETLRAQGIQPIELVVVNLYPFRETVARGAPMEEIVEQIDIGGPSMLRAAAKNYRHVAALVDPADYGPLLEALRAGAVSERLRYDLMRKVFAHTAAYDLAIAEHFAARDEHGKLGDEFPDWTGVPARKRQSLRYGENPHQKAAWYAREGWTGQAGLAAAKLLQGKELSYNNLLDLHAASACVREFATVTAVIVKHNTPCGAATGAGLEAAYRAARAGDETSAFGGIVAVNDPVDEATARALAETFLEAVVAPSFAPAARELLSAKKNLRLLELPALQWDATQASGLRGPGAPGFGPLEIRSIGDGLLVQEADLMPDDSTTFRVVTKRAPSELERQALLFGWRIVKHVRSNAIVFAAADRTLAIGGGQTSRVESVELAARKGGSALEGSAVASDAFFPFRDGLDAAARAGATCVIQPGGSVRDAEVIAAADDHDLAMLFTDHRHFRH